MCLKIKEKSRFHNIYAVTSKKVMIYNYNRLTIDAFQHAFLTVTLRIFFNLNSKINSRFLSFFEQINSITASFKLFSLHTGCSKKKVYHWYLFVISFNFFCNCYNFCLLQPNRIVINHSSLLHVSVLLFGIIARHIKNVHFQNER